MLREKLSVWMCATCTVTLSSTSLSPVPDSLVRNLLPSVLLLHDCTTAVTWRVGLARETMYLTTICRAGHTMMVAMTDETQDDDRHD